jgi:hypothetical protein
MIKSLLILVLVAALGIGLFLSKPTDADFQTFMKAQSQPSQPQTMQDLGKSILGGIIGSAKAATYQYHDHFFYATEDLDGVPQYTGAFAHWWKKGAAATPATPATPAAGS